MSEPPDVAVVGGGIVGLATARALALRGRRVLVLEREPALGAHQTSHNSGVIHQGIYYAPGSLKARLCREGADRLYVYCEEHDIPAVRCGKLVVAVREAELPRLDELERRSRVNGVPGLMRLGPEGIAEVEPAVTGLAALHSPDTGMIDYSRVAAAYADDVRANGGEIRSHVAVRAIREEPSGVEVLTEDGPVRAARAVACAGAWSDRLAAASGARPDVRIVPFRGAYLRLAPGRTGLVRGQIYPVPDPELPFLGVHLSRTIAGEVLIGPTALLAGARDAYALTTIRRADLGTTLRWPGTALMIRRFWRTALRELAGAASPRVIVRDARRYVPALRASDVRPGPAGVRAQALHRDGALVDDFLFARTGRALHVLNAPSPAATASLAIADMVVAELDR
ncbi:MAG TPA: L-2-hydroxyglutarate oxidase [Solirubrobacteraceae bacterium]|nr:L-2-hydroxyglutarate oxidase [Solirubrobacteraceae bacterium]